LPHRDLPAPISPARAWAFRLVSVVVMPALLLGLAEGGLRLAGVGHRSGFTVPCQVPGGRAACENPDFSRRFFPPGLARSPISFAIPAQKGPRTFRIFILGESAALGDPEPSFGVGRFLEVMLAERHPGVRFEVINTGVVAINSHVILPIARDLAGQQGDLFVVYAGNNEVVGPFGGGTVLTARPGSLALIRLAVAASSTRLGQVLAGLAQRASGGGPSRWGGMEMFLGQQLRAGDPAMAAVYGAFERNLADIVAVARRAGAQVVVSTMGTRRRDFAPLASLHRLGLADDQRAAWEARFATGAKLEAAGRPAEALVAFLAAEAIDDEHAELQYRLGRCALALGDDATGRSRLTRARDLDTLRFRADSRIDAIIREVAGAAGPGVQLVDGAAALDQASPHGVAGGDLFYEHVHLTPAGNHQLAAALLPAVEAALPAAWRLGPVPAGPLPLESCLARLAFTGFDRYRVAKEVLRRRTRPPLSGQSDHAEQVRELELEEQRGAAESFETSDATYRAALIARSDDSRLHLDYGILLDTRDVFLSRQGQPDPGRAPEQYRLALESMPQAPEPRIRWAEALLRLGRQDQSIARCRELLTFRPGSGQAWVTIAWAFLGQGKTAEALEALERVAALDPPIAEQARPELLFRLAWVLERSGQRDQALRTLRESVAAWRTRVATEPSAPEPLRGLAQALRALGQVAEAAALEAQATRLAPPR
jgi:tetratricopeptide (TPR) repeat protein